MPRIRGPLTLAEAAGLVVALFFAVYVPALGLLVAAFGVWHGHEEDRPGARTVFAIALLVAVLAIAGAWL